MLTVACVWVRGNVPYTAEYVERLRAMVRKALPVPHRFVCLTDRWSELPSDLECLAVTPFTGAGWWSKLHLFNQDLALGDRVLYLDLDVLVVGSLIEIVDTPAVFATIPDGGSSFQPRDHRRVIKRFNSSVMVFDAGVYADLYTEWTEAVTDQLWGDQDWLAFRHPEAATLPLEWFPRLSSIGASGASPADARVILAKKPKPVEAAKQWPWFNARWRAA